jgi:hypothetical protein
MPRTDKQITDRVYKIKDAKIKDYFGGNDEASQQYMEKIKSDLTNKQEKSPNDTNALNWISKELEDASEEVRRPKEIRMQTGAPGSKPSVNPDSNGNNFLTGTHKDKDNANPMKSDGGLPSPHKGSMRRQIMTGQMQYENIDKEIEAARYLIEYMDNNKKNKIL